MSSAAAATKQASTVEKFGISRADSRVGRRAPAMPGRPSRDEALPRGSESHFEIDRRCAERFP